jgi:glycogen(starch) synthase
MKVALLSRYAMPYHDYGGLQRHMYHMIKHLLRHQINVYLFIQKPYFKYEPFDTYHNFHPTFVDTIRLPFGKIKRTVILDRITNYPLLCLKMAKMVLQINLREKLDIIHAQGLTSFGYALQKKKRGKQLPPMIMNPQGLEEFKTKNPFKYVLYAPFRQQVRFGAKYSQKVIASDKCSVDEVKEHLRITEEKIVVLPNAIDIEECLDFVDEEVKKGLRERFALSKRSIIFLSVGRLERNKGYHLLIESLAQIKNDLPPDWCWLLIGHGSDKKLLEKKVEVSGLTSNVILPGSLNDIDLHNIYEIAHVFIHPTLYEGSSIVTLEAMAHKRPIIASATGGLPDKVKEGYNGYLCQAGDVEDLAKKIIMIMQRKKDFITMGENSFKLVQKDFSWDKVIQQYIKIYQEMIKSNKERNNKHI